MATKFISDKIFNAFLEYLSSLGITRKSLKNYKSDLSHFTGWMLFRLQTWGVTGESLKEAVPFLSKKISEEYKAYLSENKVPDKTINRRLSTLRHLSRFLLYSQIVSFDFMDGITNMGPKQNKPAMVPLLSEFRRHLEREKVSDNTIKNYLSDIKQFIYWLDGQNAVNQN